MKTFQLTAEPRTVLGKKASKALRNDEKIPVVLNGGKIVDLPYAGTLEEGQKVVELCNNKGIITTDLTVTAEAVRKLIYSPDIFAIELTVNGVKKNAKNADFEYIIAGFRVFRHFGLSFGYLPYSNIGYSYFTTEKLNDANSTTTSNIYSGSGGLHQVYLGLGWSPFKGLSIGVNGGYLYGNYTKSLVNSFSNSTINTIQKTATADVESYKVDFGLQYALRLSKKDEMTFGATYSLGHKIGGKPTLNIVSINPTTQVADTVSYPKDGTRLHLEMPTVIGAGIMYSHNNSLRVCADYTLQKWGKVEEPEYRSENGVVSYAMRSGMYKDRHRVTLGAEYCPGEYNRHFLNRVRYRVGVSYATPYYYINGIEGPKELSASLGFGIPIMNSWNNRSILNISGQWVRRSAAEYIMENTFRINIGLTFNERWFAKWKVQ